MSVLDELKTRYTSDISAFAIELPSTGKTLHFNPITSKQEEAIVKQIEAENFTMLESVMDEVINANCTSPLFDVKTIKSLDRMYIIVILYQNSRGERFEARLTCPECKDGSETKAMKISDFDLIECTTLEEKVKLSPFTIILQHPTRERDIASDTMLKDNEKDKLITMKHHSIAKYIVGCEVSGGEGEEPVSHNLEFKESLEMLGILTPEDTKKLQDAVGKMDYGLELKTDFVCKKCDKAVKDMPVTMVEFFLAY